MWVRRLRCVKCDVLWTTPVGDDECRTCWSCGSAEHAIAQLWSGQPVTTREGTDQGFQDVHAGERGDR